MEIDRCVGENKYNSCLFSKENNEVLKFENNLKFENLWHVF